MSEEENCTGFEQWCYPEYSKSEQIPPSPENLFRPGMGIELNERNYPSMLCVGRIKEVSGDYVLAHFDGWDNSWDVWYRWNSPEIRPVGTCKALNCHLYPPYQGPDSITWEKTGTWSSYLAANDAIAAPIEAFSKLYVSEFGEDSLIRSLLILSGNKVASIAHCYVGLEEFIGHSLYEKLKGIKICTICCGSYLMGYNCVKPFTIHEELRTKSGRSGKTGSVCSLSCLSHYKESFIGCRPSEKSIISQANPLKSKIQVPFHHLLSNSTRDKSISTSQLTDKPSRNNLFRVGMKLECIDTNYTTMYCPGTILRADEDEVLVNFDGWGHHWDMWLYWYSTQLRPIGTTEFLNNNLSVNFQRRIPFKWSQYLEDTKSIAAPIQAFSKLYVCEFSSNIDAIPPLEILVINKLLDREYPIKYKSCTQIFPLQIKGKPFTIKTCYICDKHYYQGYIAIPAFSLPIDIVDRSSVAQLCSRKCLKQYHKERIGEFI
ncbi:hypothetical protein LOD99_10040 [Oopsacas minuta]|uniref:Uncharacterized protein n=1 Tax=Oopsacas minuta TaxID=111878 RepID=A0AAV7KPP7_9METZ|nr:hypothetical protein LOD99_10040 [Oopsacas minuta]